jgi:hypothetical protein
MREVIVWGKGLNHGVAHVDLECKDTVETQGIKTYLHQVDIRVTHMSNYTLYVPKLPV